MPAANFDELLDRAASLHGIDAGFWDIWGHYHATPAAVKQSLLAAMGVPAGSAEELELALAARTRREWERLAPPTVVTGESAQAALPLNVPAELLGEAAAITVRREDGAVSEFKLGLLELEQVASIEMSGATWVRKVARLEVALPLGYHDITVKLAGASATTRYIVTPERAWTDPHLGRGGKLAGLTISLYGVRSERNWGCGDFRDLEQIVDWTARDLQASFVGLNPLHAIHNRRPFNTSPYLPTSTLYRNFLYLDVESVEDWADCRRALRLRATPPVAAEIETLRGAPCVEYERVAALKLRFLKLLFASFLRQWRRGSPRARDFEAYRRREGDSLERFAMFCALDERLHQHRPDLWLWTEWPAAYQDPDSAETTAFRSKHWRLVMFYQYLQWQIDLQLSRVERRARDRRLALGLYHDLALATDRFGSDLWAYRKYFVAGCRVGSPPDDFAPKGQDWCFPPPHARWHRENGYRLFAESIRKNARHGGALRMDHVMRLFRLYWIPDGADATEGAYVRETSEDFIRILALESVRNRVVLVGEDLGTVEPETREALARYGVLSYRLFYFERDPSGAMRRPDQYPRQALVSSTTHDLPTLAGFWLGTDIAARRAAGVLDNAGFAAAMSARQVDKQRMLDVLLGQGLLPAGSPREASAYGEMTGAIHNAVIGFLALTPSQLLAINQEDLTKETAQQNLPGTTWQYPNWSRKMRFTVEQLQNDPEARGFTAMFRHWIGRSGRTNQQG
ncbi:MAG: 4-alpha-glucanotransferase [Bryobacteraceae bacterium]